MACAQQCGEVSLPLTKVNRFASERTDSFTACKSQGRVEGPIARGIAHRLGRIRIDTHRAQSCRDSSFAKATPHKGRPSGSREPGIVDIAQCGTPLDHLIEWRLIATFPTAFGDLSCQIGPQPRTAGRITANIGDSQCVEGR